MSEFDMNLLIEELQERNDNLNKENNELSLENQRLYNLLDKIKEYIKENACYDKDIKQCCRDLLTDKCDYILELLEEIK